MKEICGIPLSNAELRELNFAAATIEFVDSYPSPRRMVKLLGNLEQSAKGYRSSIDAIMKDALLCTSIDNRLAPEQLAESFVRIERVLRAVRSVMPRHAPQRKGNRSNEGFKNFIFVAERTFTEHGLKPTANNPTDLFVRFVREFHQPATQERHQARH